MSDYLDLPAPQVRERIARGVSGWPVLGGAVAVLLASAGGFIVGLQQQGDAAILSFTGVSFVFGLAALIVLAGLTPVAPGEARVLQLLGRYTGTVRTDGLRWVNPLTNRRRVSTRIRNHETDVLKVNDADGNPIEIASVVVWQVEDTARAVFEVDDFIEFVAIQTETAVRHIANSYSYDSHDTDRMSLRDNADEITARLSEEIGVRVAAAGVKIVESRLTRLAYAPEIAHAMLRRQQANAIVAARSRIVEGAVGMVEMALSRLADNHIVDLDEERKAAMVSNLLVVLCGDRDAQPVVNAGTLYS
ncbi:SPFH domain-containing protein [Actinoplanes derwentensis]|uniref:SPFH domain / Band 7 family protein n=1 Tax=Actinoplanes derwentensis TaxID=113562 RepID=A0A1H1RNN7_9ACTN|nr:SPFH domain-containing protein [Actinoplanes derwentensis]GID84477.1 membrane protein [Actinoplanes derwentensis]SDS37314.1 SPFH domain / Band 7 family protein [Actinoplanes derwentensis]